MRLAVELGVDFVAASFVRTADDVLEVRRAIENEGGRLGSSPRSKTPPASSTWTRSWRWPTG